MARSPIAQVAASKLPAPIPGLRPFHLTSSAPRGARNFPVRTLLVPNSLLGKRRCKRNSPDLGEQQNRIAPAPARPFLAPSEVRLFLPHAHCSPPQAASSRLRALLPRPRATTSLPTKGSPPSAVNQQPRFAPSFIPERHLGTAASGSRQPSALKSNL
jgi:hypothetical protein